MRRTWTTLVLCGFALAVCACGSKATAHINGRVWAGSGSYPSDAVLVVRVADVTVHPATLLAEDRRALVPGWEAPSTHPPHLFDVGYEPSKVVAGHRYVAWAAVYASDGLIAASEVQSVTASGRGSADVQLWVGSIEGSVTAPPVP